MEKEGEEEGKGRYWGEQVEEGGEGGGAGERAEEGWEEGGERVKGALARCLGKEREERQLVAASQLGFHLHPLLKHNHTASL